MIEAPLLFCVLSRRASPYLPCARKLIIPDVYTFGNTLAKPHKTETKT